MLFPAAHKVIMEEALVKRREADKRKQEFWTESAHYFDQVHRKNGKFAAWSSDHAYKTR
jgi:hypothetical protein